MSTLNSDENTNLSKLLDWVEKAPPGPPPRAGLKWKDSTHRWIISDPDQANPEDPRVSPVDTKPTINRDTLPTKHLTEDQAQNLMDLMDAYDPIFESVMTSFSELFDSGEVSGRKKTFESAAEKVSRKNYESLDRLTDLVGTRIEFPDNRDVLSAVDEIEQRFTIIEQDNHHLKDGYYTAVHMLIEVDGKPVEVQVRTHSHGKIANYAHDTLYKESEHLKSDPGILDDATSYLSDWGHHLEGYRELAPPCPQVIRIVIGCLEDMPAGVETPQEMFGQPIESMLEKGVLDEFKAKIYGLLDRITAPQGKYRLIEADPFDDPVEADTALDDFFFIDEAQAQKQKLQEANPSAKYLIYDEDSKLVG